MNIEKHESGTVQKA